jgi:hypothetical protein
LLLFLVCLTSKNDPSKTVSADQRHGLHPPAPVQLLTLLQLFCCWSLMVVVLLAGFDGNRRGATALFFATTNLKKASSSFSNWRSNQFIGHNASVNRLWLGWWKSVLRRTAIAILQLFYYFLLF